MIASSHTSTVLIDGLVESTKSGNAVEAIRLKATQAIDSFVACFGQPESMPLDLLTLASFLGIKQSLTPPAFSPDAELAPDGDGGVEMRVNPDQPETRQRFSIGHEITHTFFPDHSSHVWPRADSRYRNLNNPNDYIEMLCDIGAAELVFPRRWFLSDAKKVSGAADIVMLATSYKASREATIRRFAELHHEVVAAVYFGWKLKPTQIGQVGRPDQQNMFGITAEEEIRGALRLRVLYTIPSEAFSNAQHYLPRDKSIQNTGPVYQAASTGCPSDGDSHLDFGQAKGNYRIYAVPLWTPDDERGPNGENAVAAVIKPLEVSGSKKKRRQSGPELF